MSTKNNRPSVETIFQNPGSSFSIRHFNEPNPDTSSRFWHMHAELELVYVSDGSGKRHIGNHLDYFSGGELVMIGSNLPHSGFSDRFDGKQKETVIQFSPDFLGEGFFNKPEFASIAALFQHAEKGISFSKEVRQQVGDKIEGLVHLKPFERLLSFLDILHHLSQTKQYQLLNADGMSLTVNKQDNDRMRIIYKYIKANFHQAISLKEVAQLVALTEPSFSRYFKQSTGKTFTQFVTEYRLIHASKLLSEGEDSISTIAMDCGFNNFSYFNKSFKKQFGKTARQYRQSIKELIA